ncbi:MAG: hypothetical protein SGBAC_010496 [Bacillariaceae sp.]
MNQSNLDIHQLCRDTEDDDHLASLVLDKSIEVHKQDRYGWTLLSIAARRSKEKTVSVLIEKRRANVNQTNKHDKSTPLYWASREGDVEMVQLLLKHKANPNKANKNGLTPLLVAARERQDAVIKVLLASSVKVDVDQTDLSQRTPLHYACESEPRSTAVLLLEHGASNLPDKAGITPFHIVCRQKWEDVVDLLLSRIVASGDTQLLSTRDQFDRLPIHYMVSLQFDLDKKRWRNPQHPTKFCLLSALLDLEKRNLKLLGNYPDGASFLVKDPYGHLPANQAVRFGGDHMVEMLTLTDETNTFAVNSGRSRYLPLHRALTISYQISKRISIVEFLLKSRKEHGFDDYLYHARIIESVRTRDPKGYYPLHLALHFSPSMKIIKLLLEADAHETGTSQVISTPGPDGFLPLHTALVAEDLDDKIVKMLIDYDTTGETPLTREPKTRKLPIHFAFQKSLPSQDLLKTLIDGDWENKSVYMRDGSGCIALHHLLRMQSKGDDPKEVEALVRLLLYESEKQTFEKDDASPENRYSPLIMIEDRETGMLPLHMAFKYGAPNDVIELLMEFENPMEKDTGPSLIVDKAGKLPLHHACENPSTDPLIISKLLEHSERETIAAMDKDKNLPLFLALKLENANAEILDLLSPGKVTEKDRKSYKPMEKQKTELLDKIYQPSMNMKLKELLEQKIESKTVFQGLANIQSTEWLYRKCRNEGIEDYKVNNAIMATLDSHATIDWLNTKSYDRWSVFLLMSDMYAHITWIAVFISASKAYLSTYFRGNDEDYHHLGWILLAVSSYFLIFREGIEVFGNDTWWTYWKDPWNWFENATIGCVIASGIHFVAEEPKDINQLLITTGLFQFAFAVSFLRTTFLAYAQFVGGILNIFYELIPFFLVTGLILMAFAYGAYVQNFESDNEEIRENFKNFFESFLTLFGEFLGGPERPTTAADIMFGIVSVVILLNVVIAIISNAWDDSTGETTLRFWEYRLGFIEEVAYTKEVLSKPVRWFQYCFGKQKREFRQHERAAFSPPPLTRATQSKRMSKLQHHMSRPHDDNKPILSACEKLGFWVSYLFLLLLGLCSFGQAWPNRIRKDVFGRNKGIVVPKKEEKKANSATLDGIQKSVQQLSDAQMEQRMKKVEADMLRMKDTMDDVHDLLKKVAGQQGDETVHG